MSEQTSRPLVSVVVVNYNGASILTGCLDAVLRQDYTAVEIVVVDNASTDGSAEIVKHTFPGARLIRSQQNRGFAGGANLGYAEARGRYVALLNSDAVPPPDWLSTLVEGLESRGLALASSQVVTEDVAAEEYEMNGTINYLGYNLPREFSDLETVFYCSAAALLIDREQVGGLFPEEFFLYQEDLHLSWRLRLQGKTLGMVPASRVAHRGSYSTRRVRQSLVAYYQERNRLFNCLIFYRPWTLVRLLPYIVLDPMAKLLAGLVGRGKPPLAVLRAYGAVLTRLRWVAGMRRQVQRARTVGDREVMSLMTFRVARGDGAPAALLNRLSRLYASVAGLAFHA
jgi:hypothetical protein